MMLAIQSQQQEHHEQEIEQQPEHLYYNFIENYFIKCIQSGNEFLYNSTLFDNELERVHEKFHIPYSVSFCYYKRRSPHIVIYEQMTTYL